MKAAWHCTTDGVTESCGDCDGCRHDAALRQAADARPPMAIAVTVSQAEQDHFVELRGRSYELAVERGHMRRG